MAATLERLTADNVQGQPVIQIQEIHQVWYHVPSRMFNVTQLHRLVSPERFVNSVNDGNIRCDHYVEVRGDPKLQGLYVTMSLLAAFGVQLGLTMEILNHTQGFPTYDPADFSQVVYHIILVHTGLVPWASVTRHGKQFNFNAPRYVDKFEPHYTFLPTYFGSLKVLPPLPPGGNEYVIPEHWSKFRTVEELEDAGDLSKRTILPATGPSQKLGSGSHHPVMPIPPAAMDIDKPLLVEVLERRRFERARARPPTKRSMEAQSVAPSRSSPKRARASTTGVTMIVLPEVHRSQHRSWTGQCII
jgi:hypothetical protein